MFLCIALFFTTNFVFLRSYLLYIQSWGCYVFSLVSPDIPEPNFLLWLFLMRLISTISTLSLIVICSTMYICSIRVPQMFTNMPKGIYSMDEFFTSVISLYSKSSGYFMESLWVTYSLASYMSCFFSGNKGCPEGNERLPRVYLTGNHRDVVLITGDLMYISH